MVHERVRQVARALDVWQVDQGQRRYLVGRTRHADALGHQVHVEAGPLGGTEPGGHPDAYSRDAADERYGGTALEPEPVVDVRLGGGP